MRRRIFRAYRELKFIDDEVSRRGPGADVDDLRKRLDYLEAKVEHTRVPTSFRQLQYTLRLHIGIVRQKLH
jgi:hypothetical protein